MLGWSECGCTSNDDIGSIARSSTPRVCPFSVCSRSPVDTRHTMIVASTLPDMSRRQWLSSSPSIVTGNAISQQVTQLTKSEWLVYLCRCLPVLTSQLHIVLSQQPAKRSVPDGSEQIEVTGLRGPRYVCVVLFVYNVGRGQYQGLSLCARAILTGFIFIPFTHLDCADLTKPLLPPKHLDTKQHLFCHFNNNITHSLKH